MPSGSLNKHLVSSLNRRSFVSDENKQKVEEQSALLPKAVCQRNREYLWTHIPEQRETPALQEAENSKQPALENQRKTLEYTLGTFHPSYLPFTHLNLNHVLPQVPKVLWTPLILLSSETSDPSQLPTPTFAALFFIPWLKCLRGA